MFYLSNKKLRLLIITMLLFIFCMFLGLFNVKALTYNVDLSYKGNVLVTEQAGYVNLVTNGLPAKEIIIDIYKTISCDTDYCVITIPYTISWESNDNQTYNQDIKSFYAITWGASPNSSCSLNSGTIDCIVANNSTLPKLEIFMSPIETHPYTTLTYRVGGYCNIYSMVNIGSSISNIQNNTNDIKNSINDSTIDSSGASSSASTWNSKNATNGTITNLLTLPITLLQAIVNGLQTSCSSFSLGSLFNINITLPCINVGALIGNGLWTTIDILFSGFMILAIAKKLIKIFNDFTNLKSNQIDELYGGGN